AGHGQPAGHRVGTGGERAADDRVPGAGDRDAAPAGRADDRVRADHERGRRAGRGRFVVIGDGQRAAAGSQQAAGGDVGQVNGVGDATTTVYGDGRHAGERLAGARGQGVAGAAGGVEGQRAGHDTAGDVDGAGPCVGEG